MPLSGEVFVKFSGDTLIKYESLKEWRTHDGIDIKAAVGTDVVAVAEGKVTRVYEDPLWGTTVEITHPNSVVSVYCGLSKEVSVKEGDSLKIKDVIGKVGQTNMAELSLDPHLHFGMKKDGKWVDPLAEMDMVK